MKKRRGFALALVLCFALSLFVFNGTAYAAQSGNLGNGLSWEFDEDTGTLTIIGNGTLQLPTGASAPWAKFADRIKGLVIGEGISIIKDSVFANLTNLNKVTLPKSIKTIEKGAFSGCDKITQVQAAGNMTVLTTMLLKNNVMELILEPVAQTVNAQMIATESAVIQSTAVAAKQQAVAEGKPVKTEVISIGASTPIEVTFNEEIEGERVTIEENDISHPILQGAMAHVKRVITTHKDGTKTIKEIITSNDNNSYRSESTSILDTQGRIVYSEETAVRTGTTTSTTVTKVKTQYKNTEDKSGVQVQETVFQETGRRMIGAVLLNSDGKRAVETMYTYETRTDGQGNQTEVLVEAKQSVNDFYDNGNMKTSTNTYYAPKDSTVELDLYNEDGSINENASQINIDNFVYLR